MAARIEPSSIKVWISNKDISTNVTIIPIGRQPDNKSVLDAGVRFTLMHDIQFRGQVRFLLQSQENLLDWQVGFVQIALDRGCKIRYSGRTSMEGSIICSVRP